MGQLSPKALSPSFRMKQEIIPSTFFSPKAEPSRSLQPTKAIVRMPPLKSQTGAVSPKQQKPDDLKTMLELL